MLHNLSHNSPILSHNLPGKYRTISDFLWHPITWPALKNKLESNAYNYVISKYDTHSRVMFDWQKDCPVQKQTPDSKLSS